MSWVAGNTFTEYTIFFVTSHIVRTLLKLVPINCVLSKYYKFQHGLGQQLLQLLADIVTYNLVYHRVPEIEKYLYNPTLIND